MQQYSVKAYQRGYEKDQARIGIEVAKRWIWPYAYSYEDLLKLHARSDFDPKTRHYCFLGDEMVGYMFTQITPSDGAHLHAVLDFPRMVTGHESAAELLLMKAFETLREKGVNRVTGHLTTMSPGDILLAEKTGFSIFDWGFKVYYAYEMSCGKLNNQGNIATEIDPESDLEDISEIASIWYKRPPEWCYTHLIEWHKAGVITHVGIRKHQKWEAACMAASNDVIPSTAALFYVVTQDKETLIPMLIKVVNKCIDAGTQILIADLINEHRAYESVYQNLGFKKVADWARCEKHLS